MRELKVYKMVGEDYCDDSFCVVPSDVYLKSEADELICHQKYKRCLAMAKWCNERYILDDCLYELGKTRFYERWENRWLNIAAQFKEAK